MRFFDENLNKINMNEQERAEFIAYMEDFIKKVSGNRELSLAFLNEAGICTVDRKLTEPFGQKRNLRCYEKNC